MAAPKTARARRLGIALRAFREGAGLTLEQAADEINSTRSTLSRYENAQTLINPATEESITDVAAADAKRNGPGQDRHLGSGGTGGAAGGGDRYAAGA